MSTMTPKDDDDILTLLRKTFFDEATACLADSEAALLDLEHTSYRDEKLSEIFRSYHSVKGSAASVGFDDLAAFSHVVEDCLSALRTHPARLTSDIISLLLGANDALKYRVSTALDLPDGDPDWNVNDLRAQLATVTAALKEAPAAKVAEEHPGYEIWEDAPVSSLAAPNAASLSAALDDACQSIAYSEAGQSADFSEASQSAAFSEASQQTMTMMGANAIAPHPTCAFPREEDTTERATQPASPKQTATTKSRDTSHVPGASFKIEAEKVDAVMDMVGELVVIKSQLVETLSRLNGLDTHTKVVIGLLDKSVRELHEKTLAMRMLSLKTCFLKMQRMARDLSHQLGKPIDFQMSGEDTELDRALIERISDPLMHLCRNAIDHGIESVEARRSKDKPATGKVLLRAYRRGESVMIEVVDDGGGISRQKVLDKAANLGVLPSNIDPRDMPDSQVYDFLFQPGFSTAATVTDISGRGVGLDVVKSNIASLKGRIEVESQPDHGSIFRIAIPLTTAITDGIIVELGDKRYILPVECVKSFVERRNADVLRVEGGKNVVGVGGNHYALLNVEGLRTKKSMTDVLFVLIDTMEKTVALAVDAVHGKTQVVLKALGSGMGSAEYFSGAAVMGDGRVALVLDALGLLGSSDKNQEMVA